MWKCAFLYEPMQCIAKTRAKVRAKVLIGVEVCLPLSMQCIVRLGLS